jgi:hypothetical protein
VDKHGYSLYMMRYKKQPATGYLDRVTGWGGWEGWERWEEEGAVPPLFITPSFYKSLAPPPPPPPPLFTFTFFLYFLSKYNNNDNIIIIIIIIHKIIQM